MISIFCKRQVLLTSQLYEFVLGSTVWGFVLFEEEKVYPVLLKVNVILLMTFVEDIVNIPPL